MKVNQIKFGAMLSYFALALNVLIGLVYTPWLIRSIGESDYGLYTLAMSLIGLLAFDFGLGNATAKFVSQYLAEGRQDKVDSFLGMVYKLYLWIDAVILAVFVVLYFFLPKVYTGLTPEEMEKFKLVYVIATSFCVLSFPFIPQNGTLTSYEKFVPLKLCDLFHKLFIVATMSICLLMGKGLYALVIVNSVSGILTILLKQYVIHRRTAVKVKFSFWDFEELRTILKFVLWVTITALAQRLIFNIAPSILGIVADSGEIAVLGVAITLESYVFLFANALSGMFLPEVSRRFAVNDAEGIQALMTKIGRIQIYIIGFILIWLAAFGRHFIDVWVGNDYSLVYPCLLLIVAPSFIQLPQEIGMSYIIAANKVREQSYIFVGMGLINIILAIPFSMMWGCVGICIAICISYLIRTAGLELLFKRELKLDVARFFRDSFLKLLLPLAIVLAASLAINAFVSLSGWGGLVVKSVAMVAVFVAVMMLSGFNDYEKHLFLDPLRKLTGK